MSPNDPKLSDGGGWRGPCMAGGKAAAEARAVTAGDVRCSAWLGVAGSRELSLFWEWDMCCSKYCVECSGRPKDGNNRSVTVRRKDIRLVALVA